MSIKVTTQKIIPQTEIDRLQYSNVSIKVSKEAPYKISFNAIIDPYGVGADGKNIYNNEEKVIKINDIDEFIRSRYGTDEFTIAVEAMKKVQEAFGMLAQLYFDDVEFDSYV